MGGYAVELGLENLAAEARRSTAAETEAVNSARVRATGMLARVPERVLLDLNEVRANSLKFYSKAQIVDELGISERTWERWAAEMLRIGEGPSIDQVRIKRLNRARRHKLWRVDYCLVVVRRFRVKII